MTLPAFLQKEPQKPLIPQLEAEQRDVLIEDEEDRYVKMRELPQAFQRFLWALSRCGNARQAMKASGTEASIVYRARKINTPFREMWEAILDFRLQARQDDIEDAMFTRAITGVKKGVWYKGRLMGHEKVYSDGLLTTMAKAEMPEKYRERTQVDHSGEVGIGLNMLVVPAVQTVDDWSKNHGKGIVIEPKVDRDR